MRYKTATNWNFYQFAGFSQLSKRGAKALFEKHITIPKMRKRMEVL